MLRPCRSAYHVGLRTCPVTHFYINPRRGRGTVVYLSRKSSCIACHALESRARHRALRAKKVPQRPRRSHAVLDYRMARRLEARRLGKRCCPWCDTFYVPASGWKRQSACIGCLIIQKRLFRRAVRDGRKIPRLVGKDLAPLVADILTAAHGMTLIQAAGATGLGRSTICRMRQGQTCFGPRVEAQIRAFLERLD